MNDKRLKILSKAEINELYGIPHFTTNEQKAYFSLSKKEYAGMSDCGSLASKVHFILQLGYFKTTSQFFDLEFCEVKNDVDYILQQYFDNAKLNVKKISKKTRLKNQKLIAKLLCYKTEKFDIKIKLENMLEIKIQLSGNPIYLFHEVLCYCAEHKLMLPGFTTLQDLIGNAITCEENRLSVLLKEKLSHDDWKAIKNMLEKEDDEYILTELKKDPKSFKPKYLKAEIKKLDNHQPLRQISRKILPTLNLTKQNIQYYASLAEHYPISDLKKLSEIKQAIYILCFVHNRHEKINDNLTISFSHYIQKFKDEAGLNARERIFNEKLEINNDTKNAALVLRFFDDEDISDKESFGRVRKRAHKHVKKGRFKTISDYLCGILFDYQDIKWNEIAQLKGKITKNIRPIFKALEFSGNDSQKNLLSAVLFLKNYFLVSPADRKKLAINVPISCIPKGWKKNLMTTHDHAKTKSNKKKSHKPIEESESVVDMEKYEFMIYRLISDKIETGEIYLENSVSFKSLSSHLVSDKKWRDKTAFLKQLGNKKLMMSSDQMLDDMEKELEQLIQYVNKRIASGDNKNIKIKKSGDEITFTLPYPDTIDKENHPIFKQLPQISISNVLKFAQKDCDFMSAFTHIKPYDAKDTIDHTAMMACIIANATNLGIYKMAESSDLGYQRMQSQIKNFMRLETLIDANDAVINTIADLPIFKYWNIHDNLMYGSVDGQKFETRLHSFIARYSSKYFGVSVGISAYTLCANHIPVNTRIISSNHHESHFLFDILFNISSDIVIDWLSGDGHSINQINFALLDFIDKQFAPHFKSINTKAKKLCGFKSLKK